MSKWPWPHRAVRITFSSPVSLHRLASSTTAASACVGSGAGTMPSVRANWTPAAKHSRCGSATASIRPSSYTWREQRRHAVVAQAAGVDRVRDEVVAERVHLHQRRHPGRVAEVVRVDPPRQRRARRRLDGADRRVHRARPASPAGTGTTARRSSSRRRCSRRSGRAVSPTFASCSSASSPMTVWCSSTWLSTLAERVLASSDWRARPRPPRRSRCRASPGESGSSLEQRSAGVRSSADGDAVHGRRRTSRISMRRYGFWS